MYIPTFTIKQTQITHYQKRGSLASLNYGVDLIIIMLLAGITFVIKA